MRPFNVLGPSVGRFQRMERFNARNGGRRVGDETAVGFGMHVFVHHGGRVGGEFTDDLLENVLERDQPLNVAVFIDDERHAAFVALKIEQLRIERGSRRNEIGVAFTGRLDECLAVHAAARQFVHDLLHVQHAR